MQREQNVYHLCLKSSQIGEFEGYLASVVFETEEQRQKLEDIPMVNEFLEVFTEELPGLPLDW